MTDNGSWDLLHDFPNVDCTPEDDSTEPVKLVPCCETWDSSQGEKEGSGSGKSSSTADQSL